MSGIEYPAVPDQYLQQFRQALDFLEPQPDEVLGYFREHIHLLSLTKGQMLLETGKICDHYYFICQGAIRGFFLEGAKEITTWISVDNEMVTSISSLDLYQPAFENMQALEDSYLLAMHNDDLNRLYQAFPGFNRTGRLLLQRYYRDAEARAYISRLTNAETKYRQFLISYAHLANRIQLQYIASFLGMTLETLSRVRQKIARQKS